ncbi:2-amino-4-hydroxy-6-hydroxymethyldihydropteridine diphosphokinase [Moraxellaceae bacterium AER2_44_116]|nr:2-amino-4-hydroxy-6-hydroxymethyldihydropteridine diphosphokinase [Moraxellaceae bacterium]TQC95839.1 2-amino-4-hydroxy-6-hydroxymethyldihydropteridine diphosphokinase [Moraxellaceae bacterium AER2_44_116]
MSYLAYLGLGANLGQPQQQLSWAVHQLSALPQCQLAAVSRLYRSKPALGSPENQPDYTNAVVAVTTTLPPHQLLQQLQALENQAGRVRVERWGARVLDLDILLYAQDIIKTADLIIPHLELCHRSFVVLPLLDICPTLALPNGTKIASLATATVSDDIHVTADNTWWHSFD